VLTSSISAPDVGPADGRADEGAQRQAAVEAHRADHVAQPLDHGVVPASGFAVGTPVAVVASGDASASVAVPRWTTVDTISRRSPGARSGTRTERIPPDQS